MRGQATQQQQVEKKVGAEPPARIATDKQTTLFTSPTRSTSTSTCLSSIPTRSNRPREHRDTSSRNRNMSTITMTPSRFSSSLSGRHADAADYGAGAPSMADQLPTIDFNFDELRQRMAQFTQRFDEFIERGRKKVLEEKNAFRMNVADLEGRQYRGLYTELLLQQLRLGSEH